VAQARCGGGLQRRAAEAALPCPPARAAVESCSPARVGAPAGSSSPASSVVGGGAAARRQVPLQRRRRLHGRRQPPSPDLPPSLPSSEVGAREVVASVGPAPALEEAPVSLRIRRRREGDGKMKGVISSPLQGKKRYPSPPGEGYRHRCGWF
jgi:hypothetical protein